jgi:hypothetical protein
MWQEGGERESLQNFEAEILGKSPLLKQKKRGNIKMDLRVIVCEKDVSSLASCAVASSELKLRILSPESQLVPLLITS